VEEKIWLEVDQGSAEGLNHRGHRGALRKPWA
jgi:hypothetical protein